MWTVVIYVPSIAMRKIISGVRNSSPSEDIAAHIVTVRWLPSDQEHPLLLFVQR